MAHDGIGDRDAVGVGKMLCRYSRDVDDQSLGGVARRQDQTGPRLAAILAARFGLVTP
jgi:hypothetical protein